MFIYHCVKVSPRVDSWLYFHLAIRQSPMYNFDRTRRQFCEVSPFSVHLVLDTFDIWHAVIELSIGYIGRIRRQRSTVDLEVQFLYQIGILGQNIEALLLPSHSRKNKTIKIFRFKSLRQSCMADNNALDVLLRLY